MNTEEKIKEISEYGYLLIDYRGYQNSLTVKMVEDYCRNMVGYVEMKVNGVELAATANTLKEAVDALHMKVTEPPT